MREVVTAMVLAWCGWWLTQLFGLPLDPWLVVVLLLGATTQHAWSALITVCLLGWWAESSVLAQAGSLLGPYLLAYAILRTIAHHVSVDHTALLVPSLGGAAMAAFVVKVSLYETVHGVVLRSFLESDVLLSFSMTLVCALVLQPCFRTWCVLSFPRRRESRSVNLDSRLRGNDKYVWSTTR